MPARSTVLLTQIGRPRRATVHGPRTAGWERIATPSHALHPRHHAPTMRAMPKSPIFIIWPWPTNMLLQGWKRGGGMRCGRRTNSRRRSRLQCAPWGGRSQHPSAAMCTRHPTPYSQLPAPYFPPRLTQASGHGAGCCASAGSACHGQCCRKRAATGGVQWMGRMLGRCAGHAWVPGGHAAPPQRRYSSSNKFNGACLRMRGSSF